MPVDIALKITDIFEAFDYKAQINWTGDIGRFRINNSLYEVTIRKATPQEQETLKPFFNNFKKMKVGNIDFALIDGENRIQDSVGYIGHAAPKVFAAVAQGISELQSKYNYDILLAIAKKEHSPTNFSSRVSAYSRIVGFLSKKIGMTSLDLIQISSMTVFALFKPNLLDGMYKIKQHLENHLAG